MIALCCPHLRGRDKKNAGHAGLRLGVSDVCSGQSELHCVLPAKRPNRSLRELPKVRCWNCSGGIRLDDFSFAVLAISSHSEDTLRFGPEAASINSFAGVCSDGVKRHQGRCRLSALLDHASRVLPRLAIALASSCEQSAPPQEALLIPLVGTFGCALDRSFLNSIRLYPRLCWWEFY